MRVTPDPKPVSGPQLVPDALQLYGARRRTTEGQSSQALTWHREEALPNRPLRGSGQARDQDEVCDQAQQAHARQQQEPRAQRLRPDRTTFQQHRLGLLYLAAVDQPQPQPKANIPTASNQSTFGAARVDHGSADATESLPLLGPSTLHGNCSSNFEPAPGLRLRLCEVHRRGLRRVPRQKLQGEGREQHSPPGVHAKIGPCRLVPPLCDGVWHEFTSLDVELHYRRGLPP
mmetsp:Transcript_49653/g.142417  ORF Transcript_49653/g.142417 Transcript_49653/m.142417 type:complete len:231 (+) Transcript_49653:315-1007(+)